MSVIVEKRGVARLEEALLKTNSIVPNINTDDKIPAYDGDIQIYKFSGTAKRKNKKEDLLGLIRVQVKSHLVSEYKNKFSIDRKDLEKYQMENGVIYYVVQFKDNDYKIFMCELFNVEIKNKLNNKMTSHKKSFLYTFDELDETNLYNVYEKHKRFLDNSLKQIIQNDKYLSVMDVLKVNREAYFSFELNISKDFTPKQLATEIFKQKPFICYDCNGLSIPLERFSAAIICYNRKDVFNFINESTTHEILSNFENGKVCEINIDKNLHIININDSGTSLIKLNKSDDINERISDLKLLLSINNETDFKLHSNNRIISIFKNAKFLTTEQKNSITYEIQTLDRLTKILGHFSITKKINILELSNADIKNINILYELIISKKTISYKNDLSGIYSVQIANINLLIYCELVKGKYRYRNLFESDKKVVVTQDKKEVSNYFALLVGQQKNEIIFYDNVDYEKMVESVLVCAEKWYLDLLNNLLLLMIKYYDEKKEIAFLDIALQINNYLYENEVSVVNIINRYQIKFRTSKLDRNEIIEILKIKENSEDLFVKCASCLLLKSYSEFELYFEKMDFKQKELFKNYPIYSLYN